MWVGGGGGVCAVSALCSGRFHARTPILCCLCCVRTRVSLFPLSLSRSPSLHPHTRTRTHIHSRTHTYTPLMFSPLAMAALRPRPFTSGAHRRTALMATAVEAGEAYGFDRAGLETLHEGVSLRAILLSALGDRH